MSLVADAAFFAKIILPDEYDPKCDALLSTHRPGGVFVPALWQNEMVNLLLMAERRQRIAAALTPQLVTQVRRLFVQLSPVLTDSQNDQMFALARKHRLTAYDATYLELAMRLNASLATYDRELIAAAAAAAAEGVTVP